MFAIAGALLIGLSLGLLGSGGSILTVPVLVFLVGEPEKLAITESLGIVSVIAGIGALQHTQQKHIDWRTVRLVGPPAMIGSYAGAWLSQWLHGRVQLLMFAAVMLLAAYRMFMNSRRSDELQPSYCRPWCLLGLGTGLGILSGLVGVGGGFLIVPALVLLGGLAMPIAVGTSLIIICLSSLVGFAKHLHLLHAENLSLHWPMLFMFVMVGALGSLVSQPLGQRLPQHKLQQAYSVMVAVMAGAILWQAALVHSN